MAVQTQDFLHKKQLIAKKGMRGELTKIEAFSRNTQLVILLSFLSQYTVYNSL